MAELLRLRTRLKVALQYARWVVKLCFSVFGCAWKRQLTSSRGEEQSWSCHNELVRPRCLNYAPAGHDDCERLQNVTM